MTYQSQSPSASSDRQDSPPVLWQPKSGDKTRLHDYMDFLHARTGNSFPDYDSLHRWSVENIEEFWNAVWDFTQIIGEKGAQTITPLAAAPYARFFDNGTINYAENILKYAHETPDAPAIIAATQDQPADIITWRALTERVSQWAQTLESFGVTRGDRIAVYMPNIPEAMIIFLAAASQGIVFASAGSEMGGDDLINRLGQIKPKILIAADGYTHGAKIIDRMPIISRAAREIPGLKTVILYPLTGTYTPETNDKFIHAKQCLNQFTPKEIVFHPLPFNHPLYILFSSGTTGAPKCFEHSTGGVLLKHMCEHVLQSDIRKHDRVFYHATPSWMMWNWLISALGCGASILLYDGAPSYPDALAQWRFTAAHGCTHHGSAAPVILSWRDAHINPAAAGLNLSPLRMILSTGAVLPEQGFTFIHDSIKLDVKISPISGGTDIVGCFVSGNPITPTYAGQINGAMLGMDVRVWDDEGAALPAGQAGELVCAKPFPSMPLRFLNDETGERYESEYFSYYPARKVWRHGDSIVKTPQGQFVIIGRSDATLNQNGVRIGAIAIYQQLEPFKDDIVDFAAVDFTRPDNKQAITILFLQMKGNGASAVPDTLQTAIRKAVRDNITPYAVPTEIIAAPGILKTPNGKKAEVVIKKILLGKTIPNPTLYGAELVKFYEETGTELYQRYTEQK